MTCFEGALADPVFMGMAGIIALAGFTLVWMLRTQSFNGKPFYALSFIGVMWSLFTIGLESASSTFGCQFQWATLAWLGHGLIPVAWCFFVFDFVENAAWVQKRAARSALILLPVAIFALAATNQWHHLIYAETSVIPEGRDHIDYVHGPGFYVVIAGLYLFVIATLVCLSRAFARAKRAAWPLLSMLTVITLTPLAMNAAYVGLGFTVFGLDPTPFMFTLGILAFSWLLVTNKTMDMASVGKSILFNTMSEPVVIIDRHRNIVSKNTAAARNELLNDAARLLDNMLETTGAPSTSRDFGHVIFGSRAYEPRIQEIESPLDPSGTVLGWSAGFGNSRTRVSVNPGQGFR